MKNDFSELIEYLDEKFQNLDQKFQNIDISISQLPTKSYLDDKLPI